MKINTRFNVLALAAAGVCFAASAEVTVPEVSNVRLSQDEGSRKVTITYDLTNAPAIVTFDIQTNTMSDASGEWKSIGGENIDFVTGEANKVVKSDGTDLRIDWRADRSWPNHVIPSGCARAVVTAWTTNDAPNYMVVSLSKANPEINFYADASFVPGGVTNNPAYKTSKMVFRRINARGVKWQMGTVANTEGGIQADETTHDVTLDHDYYLAVFPLTQAQWTQVKENNPSWHWPINGAWRPADIVGVQDARGAIPNGDPVAETSFMGVLGARTGLKFDLPLESEWEFACRAGWGSGYWPNGKKMLKQDVDAGLPGRYRFNGGYINGTTAPDPATADVDVATPVVGTNGANDWGLYDMLGCLFEFCRDYYQADITGLNGALCTQSSGRYVRRGGSFTVTAQSWARSGARQSDTSYKYSDAYNGNGYNTFRVACYSFAD